MNVVDQFTKSEKELAKNFPNTYEEAKELARRIADPQTASADEIWPRIWNKPLYANTRVPIGAKWAQQLALHMNGAWHHWGTDASTFLIEKTGKGIALASFELNKAAAEIQQKTRIPIHRLYAIQGAAQALRIRAAKSETPYADLTHADLEITVQTLREEMGSGWGPITVLHFLTDLGLACKPDLHLVKTVQYLWPALNLRQGQAPNLPEAVAINRKVRWLVEQLDGSFSPVRLRYIDKVLMEISKRNLIPNG